MQAKGRTRRGLAIQANAGQIAQMKTVSESLRPVILVVDDDKLICLQLEMFYNYSNYRVEIATSGEEALQRLEHGDIDLVVADIRLPGISGVELTAQVRNKYPGLPVIAITAHAAIETAIEVLKQGACDYLLKPFDLNAIREVTETALDRARVFIEIRQLRRSLKNAGEFGGMLSRTPEMHRVFEIIQMVSTTDVTVLVEGETGTGKELVASAIHYQSQRRDGPFVPINCAGFPESLLESELFGYERGAFTGADRARPGMIELAHGGTLFLDEIESISLGMQSKLLRVLEDQKVQRLGGSRTARVDMRVIAASNLPLDDLVAEGKVRRDFYYRLNVIPIRLLPLRQRREDIPLLVHDFISHHPIAKQKGITGVSAGMMDRLIQHHWPGNIRELQNILEKGIVLATGRLIDSLDLPVTKSSATHGQRDAATTLRLDLWLKEQEKQYLTQQLKAFQGKIGLTARTCGLGLRTLTRKMQLYGLSKRDFQRNTLQRFLTAPETQTDDKKGSTGHGISETNKTQELDKVVRWLKEEGIIIEPIVGTS
jgi:two-component system response regulator HydG